MSIEGQDDESTNKCWSPMSPMSPTSSSSPLVSALKLELNDCHLNLGLMESVASLFSCGHLDLVLAIVFIDFFTAVKEIIILPFNVIHSLRQS